MFKYIAMVLALVMFEKSEKSRHPQLKPWVSQFSSAGIDERLGVLARHYTRAGECYLAARQQYLVKQVASDDILDAIVGAVTAMQYPRLSTLPENPLEDEEGIPMEIVYFADA